MTQLLKRAVAPRNSNCRNVQITDFHLLVATTHPEEVVTAVGVMSDVGPGDGGYNYKRPARPATRDGLTIELRSPARLMCYIGRCHNHEQ
jgi:hypothetical protein